MAEVYMRSDHVARQEKRGGGKKKEGGGRKGGERDQAQAFIKPLY
jgi:hypothetical protein